MLHDLRGDRQAFPPSHVVHVVPCPVAGIGLFSEMEVFLFGGWDPERIYVDHLAKIKRENINACVVSISDRTQRAATVVLYALCLGQHAIARVSLAAYRAGVGVQAARN